MPRISPLSISSSFFFVRSSVLAPDVFFIEEDELTQIDVSEEKEGLYKAVCSANGYYAVFVGKRLQIIKKGETGYRAFAYQKREYTELPEAFALVEDGDDETLATKLLGEGVFEFVSIPYAKVTIRLKDNLFLSDPLSANSTNSMKIASVNKLESRENSVHLQANKKVSSRLESQNRKTAIRASQTVFEVKV